jgi:hypothetical protein
MRLVTMLSAAMLIVALGLSGADAQSPGSNPGAGGPSAAPSIPPSEGAGGATDMAPGGPSAGAMQNEQGGPNLGGPKGNQPPLNAESGENAEGKSGAKAEGKNNLQTGGQPGANAKNKGDLQSNGQAGNETKGKTGATAQSQKSGKDGKSARLETQQVSKVKGYFSQHKPAGKAIDKTEVSVSIGIALPGAIALYDLPPDVIVVSGPCPIKYFVWGDDVVLVDSCTREVVEIIAGVA